MAILTTDVKNANVKFLNGLQRNVNDLITNGGATKGAFYLTSDTHRLYIGQEDNTRNNIVIPVPVNEGVTTVANVNALSSLPTTETGAFYYATQENILCVYNGSQWVQINPDTNTTIKYFYSTIVDNAASNKSTLTYVLTESTDNEKTTAVDFVGANGITVSSTSGANFDGNGDFLPNASKVITITGDDYSLSKSVASNIATLTLSSSDTNKTSSSVEIQGKNNVIIGTENNKITIASTDTYISNLDIINANNNGNGFTVVGTYNNSNEITSSFDPIVSLNGTQDFHFINGKASIPVYTRSEIDTRINQLNSMTFMGVIGPGQLMTAVPTGTNKDANNNVRLVRTGDTYKMGVSASIHTGSNQYVNVGVGDQIIAQGTEYTATDAAAIADPSLIGTIDPATLYWAYIPSGDDTVTVNSYIGERISNGITLIQTPGGQEVLSFVVNGDGKYIAVTGLSSTGTSQTLTVQHNEISAATVVSTAVKAFDVVSTAVDHRQGVHAEMTIPVITEINRDAAGHVKNIVVSNYRVRDTVSKIDEGGFATTITGDNTNKDYAKIQTNLTLVDEIGTTVSTATTNLVLESNTVQISTSTRAIGGTTYNSILMELIWGSF